MGGKTYQICSQILSAELGPPPTHLPENGRGPPESRTGVGRPGSRPCADTPSRMSGILMREAVLTRTTRNVICLTGRWRLMFSAQDARGTSSKLVLYGTLLENTVEFVPEFAGLQSHTDAHTV